MKKKVVWFLLLCISVFSVFGGDNIYGIVVCPIVQADVYDYPIIIKKEVYTFTLFEDYYSIETILEVCNYDSPFRTKFAIPVIFGEGESKLYDCSVEINNNHKKSFKTLSQGEGQHLITIHEPPYKDYETYKRENVYDFDINIDTGITVIKIDYKQNYQFNNFEKEAHVNCYYGVDESLGGYLGSFEFNLVNNSSHVLLNIGQLPTDFSWKNENTLTYKNNSENFIQSYDSYSFIIKKGTGEENSFITKLPEYITEGKKYETFQLPMEINIELLTKKQLRVLRNSFFAYYGYDFKSQDLKTLFENTTWYKINPNYSDSLMSYSEKQFIKKLQKEEEKF